jgi:hypothetical protein
MRLTFTSLPASEGYMHRVCRRRGSLHTARILGKVSFDNFTPPSRPALSASGLGWLSTASTAWRSGSVRSHGPGVERGTTRKELALLLVSTNLILLGCARKTSCATILMYTHGSFRACDERCNCLAPAAADLSVLAPANTSIPAAVAPSRL